MDSTNLCGSYLLIAIIAFFIGKSFGSKSEEKQSQNQKPTPSTPTYSGSSISNGALLDACNKAIVELESREFLSMLPPQAWRVSTVLLNDGLQIRALFNSNILVAIGDGRLVDFSFFVPLVNTFAKVFHYSYSTLPPTMPARFTILCEEFICDAKSTIKELDETYSQSPGGISLGGIMNLDGSFKAYKLEFGKLVEKIEEEK